MLQEDYQYLSTVTNNASFAEGNGMVVLEYLVVCMCQATTRCGSQRICSVNRAIIASKWNPVDCLLIYIHSGLLLRYAGVPARVRRLSE